MLFFTPDFITCLSEVWIDLRVTQLVRHFYILLPAHTGCHLCVPLTLITSITFLRRSSFSCCKSFSISEGAKRFRESSSWEIILFLLGLSGNFAGPTLLFPLGSLEGEQVSCLSLLRSSGCPLVWALLSFSIFSSKDLESLLTELSKAEPKLFRESFSASVSALNCESCFLEALACHFSLH